MEFSRPIGDLPDGSDDGPGIVERTGIGEFDSNHKGTIMHRHVSTVALTLVTAFVTLTTRPGFADIYRWDNGQLITTRDIEPYGNYDQMDLQYGDFNGATTKDNKGVGSLCLEKAPALCFLSG